MNRTLSQWLEWMEQIHPDEIRLGLDRVYSVAQTLGIRPLDCGGALSVAHDASPHRLAKHIVIVAGTNGKGSTIATLQNLVQQAGMSSLVYTSPHFEHYSERFEIDGVPASDQVLCSVLERIEAARNITPLTFFEYSTLAALVLCMDLRPDVAILEVGLGGRLDAINIVPADIAVITQIDLDHQDWLGDTRELIGAEKAGILRTGIDFVCADREPTDTVKAKAKHCGAQSYYLGTDYDLVRSASVLLWQSRSNLSADIQCPDPGLHTSSIAAALKTFELIQGKALSDANVLNLSSLHLAGRQQQMLFRGTNLLLDVAHNPAATAHLRRSLIRFNNTPPAELVGDVDSGLGVRAASRTFAVFAVMADKAWQDMVELISDVIDGWFLAELPGNQRAESNEVIADFLQDQQCSVPTNTAASVGEALEHALASADSNDRVLVFGSFFTVAAALDYVRSSGEFDG